MDLRLDEAPDVMVALRSRSRRSLEELESGRLFVTARSTWTSRDTKQTYPRYVRE